MNSNDRRRNGRDGISVTKDPNNEISVRRRRAWGCKMEKKEFVCIGCPLGCNVTVEAEGKEIKSITGNTCPRGADYVTKELTDPRRIVTSLVRVSGGELPVVSVKTAADIPKDKIGDCIKVLKEIELRAPVRIGDVVAENVCGSGVNVIATRPVAAV